MHHEFYTQGEKVEDFLADLGEARPKFDQLLTETALDDDQLRSLSRLAAIRSVLIIAEPWSGDVLYNLPPLIRLGEAAGWEMRVFRRDQHPDLITPYRKDGIYHSIPVFVFYDEDFCELGHWVERPKLATRTIDEESLKLRRRLREDHKVQWRVETIAELLELLEPAE